MMSRLREPDPGQLILSILSSRWDSFWPALEARLEEHFGPVEYRSPEMPFEHTHYYEKEFGTPLIRRILSFERLLPLDRLRDAKLFAVELERECASDGKRLFNLDPGLVTLERVVLATGKNFTHRIYQGGGVWADLTLMYTGGDWVDFPWTFPDYAAANMRDMLTKIRSGYKNKLETIKNMRGSANQKE